MNHECYGDFFTADGVRYYRCFGTGGVITAIDAKRCAECGREIVGKEHGEVKTVAVKFAILAGGMYDDGARIELP